MTPQLEAWLSAVMADAEKRGLPELKALLESLAKSTDALRSADTQVRLRAEPGT
jgi:hypothetical protein